MKPSTVIFLLGAGVLIGIAIERHMNGQQNSAVPESWAKRVVEKTAFGAGFGFGAGAAHAIFSPL
jgi:hypothetical protein